MRTPASIPETVKQKQREASDPGVSAFVAANAGSGKTYVLAQRVINLLLEGIDPQKILCITFTKAAAANMSKQVFDRLAHWTTLDDAALGEAIREHSGTAPNPPRRALARRLFARALETPGGLKVQTIHAFCTQILHQFPFEANVAARFTVLDEAEQSELQERLTLGVLLEGAAHPDSDLNQALQTAMTAAADQTFRDVVREAINMRDQVIGWVTSAGGVKAAITNLSKDLGVDAADNVESIDGEILAGSTIAPSEWPSIASALAKGGKTDGDQAQRFESLTTLADADRLETYLDIFCTAPRTPRASIVTKSITDANLTARLRAEQERICALLGRRRAVVCRDRSAAILTVTHEVLARYRTEKERRGFLDYDDLIDKTLELLNSVDAKWVHYKLDLGIDHVLIDEAQDTSHKQWDIVRLLTAEFTAGAGARDVTRTIFAVGDEKQSIYSFQDAAPKEFADMRRYFQSAHKASGLKFVPSKFEHSFRSGANVLGAVDEVFRRTVIARSVSSDTDGFPPHIALADTPPGIVELWEPEKPDERQEMEGWDAPFDTLSETSPRVKLAKRIARAVRKTIEDGAARAGDVLILVRQRGELFEAIIGALKNENVQVAGADRLMLTEHIAVMDLLVLADALLLPQDDLALATVLRSPLFGFSDDDLFAVAWNRRSSLRSALRRKASERPIFANAVTRLDELAQIATRETPFAFYAQVLGQGSGRRQFLTRLGVEANDALDEFLSLAFEYERRQTPSLQGFLTWLRDARAEVKRDMEIARDEVRVMTVHGAKGLEAPIVFLADTITPPAGPRPPRLIRLADGAVIWAGRKDDDVPLVANARAAALQDAEDEYRRLLYVGMTRAADRLVICGADGRNKRPDLCWYNLVREPLKPFLVEEEENGEMVLRYRKPGVAAAAERAIATTVAASPRPRPELPPWLREPAPAQAPQLAPLSPSSAFEEQIGRIASAAGTGKERRKALERGRIVHRLLQSLPDIPPARRPDAAERYLDRADAELSPTERTEITGQVLALLADAKFARIFAIGSRAEVPIIGYIDRAGAEPVPVSGQVDRLSITDDAVLIADYKSDGVVPARLDEVPQPYIAQLSLYRALLTRLYPKKAVLAALVFTSGPRLIEVPASAMDAAVAQVLTETHSPVNVT